MMHQFEGYFHNLCVLIKLFSFIIRVLFDLLQICEKDISETFGDSDEFNDDTGIAYMLIYRKIDPSVNSLPLTLDELPQRIVVRFHK